MSFARAAARAALASGAIVVIGASCKPERLTSPSSEIETAPALRASTSRGVKIASHPDTVQLGQTVQLTTQGGGSISSQLKSATTTTTAVTWVSLDSAVLRVNSSGEVTAIGAGNGRVVAQSSSQADTAKMYVLVSVASVVATPDNGTVTVGQTSQLTAVAKDALGQTVSGAPIAWSSTNAAAARVSATGVVTGVAVGTAGIVAEANGHADTVNVTVTAVPVGSVAVAPTSASVAAGATTQLTATVKDANGATLTDRLVTWTSSNAQVATVAANGVVSGVAAGTVTVTATVDGKTASASVTVTTATVASVTATVNASSLTVGQTTQATAVAKDASGATLSGRTVTWASSNAAVATVSSSGLVTAVAAGTATLTATIDGVKGTVAVTVTNVAVASVSVTVNSASIAAGQTAQATATALDANGKPITGRTVAWSSSNTAVATVSSTGVVTGVSAGVATITATVDGQSGQVSVTVTTPTTSTPTTPTSPGAVATLPELPRAIMDARSVPAPTGTSIRVNAGGDLQAAFNAAQPGDEIVLASGATFTGNFVLPAKPSGSAWITVRSDAPLPAPGTRVRPSDATGWAKILANQYMPAIEGAPGSNHWRFMGVEVSATSSLAENTALVSIGSLWYDSESLLAHHFVFDRVYFHGTPTLDVRRCLLVAAASIAVVDSYFGDCHSNNTDSQAILGDNSPGPFTIVNNTLEGAAENVMFGGSDPQSSAFVPADITIKGNHFIKPLAWQGKWMAKNLLEMKLGKRVLVEGNVFENSWASAQAGFAIVLWSVNQDGRAPYSETSDVTFRYNIVRNANNGFQLTYGDNWSTTVPMHRVAITHNTVTGIGTNTQMGAGGGITFQIAGNIADLTIAHNTTDANGFWTRYVDNPGVAMDRLTILDNIGFHVQYDAMHSDYGIGSQVWSVVGASGGGNFLGNVLAGAPVYGTITWPAGNSYPVGGSSDATAAIGFVNAAGGDYTLSSSSPYRGKATDGTDPGANIAEVRNRTSAAIQAY